VKQRDYWKQRNKIGGEKGDESNTKQRPKEIDEIREPRLYGLYLVDDACRGILRLGWLHERVHTTGRISALLLQGDNTD